MWSLCEPFHWYPIKFSLFLAETEEVEHQVLTSGDEDQQPLKGEGEMNSEAVVEEKGEVSELTELEDPEITLRMAVQGLNFW